MLKLDDAMGFSTKRNSKIEKRLIYFEKKYENFERTNDDVFICLRFESP